MPKKKLKQAEDEEEADKSKIKVTKAKEGAFKHKIIQEEEEGKPKNAVKANGKLNYKQFEGDIKDISQFVIEKARVGHVAYYLGPIYKDKVVIGYSFHLFAGVVATRQPCSPNLVKGTIFFFVRQNTA